MRDEAFDAASRVRRVRFACKTAQREQARRAAAPVLLRRLLWTN